MNHFIELPDGTIINVAHVVKVRPGKLANYGKGAIPDFRNYIWIKQVSDKQERQYRDTDDGQVYAYFHGIAQKIGEVER